MKLGIVYYNEREYESALIKNSFITCNTTIKELLLNMENNQEFLKISKFDNEYHIKAKNVFNEIYYIVIIKIDNSFE